MRRRDVLAALSGLVVLPAVSRAQLATKPPLIGWMGVGNAPAAAPYQEYLRQGLRDQGDIDGQQYTISARYAEYRPDRLPAVAEEVVKLNPTVIVGSGTDAVVAARNATSTIPIVTAALADAEPLGLVQNYAHPGGNVTGITPYVAGLPAKQMELAREVVPNAKNVGLLGNLNDPKAPPQRDELAEAAQKFGLNVVVPVVHGPEDLPGAVAALASEQVDMVIVLQTTIMLSLRKEVGLLLATHHLPAVYGYREHIAEGGLLSYGVDLPWCWRRLGFYVHRILNGVKPAELPVEFPSKLQLVVNLKAAQALGVSIPSVILARADEVIE